MRLTLRNSQLTLATVMLSVALLGGQWCDASGAWGGSLGGGSTGYYGGSWGARGNFPTPVRNFFAYRQPVRSLFRGLGGYYSNGSAGGWRGGSWGSGSASHGGWGGASSGYNYYGSSSGFSTATYCNTCVGTNSGYAYPTIANGCTSCAPTCSDCVGVSGSMASMGVSPTEAPYSPQYGETVIQGDQSIIPAEEYYDSQGSPINTEGSGTRALDSPPIPQPSDETTYLRRPTRGDAILTVNVPEDALVFVNDHLKKTRGVSRSYRSRDLRSDKDYQFNLEAVVIRDGKRIALKKEVSLTAGVRTSVDFEFDRPILTQLTVKVPHEAKVELCGNSTAAMGETRNFKTRLMPGEVWDNYEVEISYREDGQLVKKRKSLSIEAGQKYVVDFNEMTNGLYVSK